MSIVKRTSAPLRGVVNIFGKQGKYVLELSCGHLVRRKLLRMRIFGRDFYRAGCQVCQKARRKP